MEAGGERPSPQIRPWGRKKPYGKMILGLSFRGLPQRQEVKKKSIAEEKSWSKKIGKIMFKSTALEPSNLDSSFAIDWTVVPPTPKSCVEILLPDAMLFEGGAFGRWLGHEGGALMNGIGSLIKETPERFFVPSTMWGHTEKVANYHPGPHQTLNLPGPWFWNSQSPDCEK